MSHNNELTIQEQAERFLANLELGKTDVNIFKHERDYFAKLHRKSANDNKLSFKAIGMLLVLVDNVTSWNVCLNEIATRATDGIKSVRSGIKELEDRGYVYRYQPRKEDGDFDGWRTLVFESLELRDLLLPRLLADRRFAHTPSAHPPKGDLTRVINNESKINKSKTIKTKAKRTAPANASLEGEDDFLKVEAIYPNSSNRKRAIKYFPKVKAKHGLNPIVQGIERQIQERQWADELLTEGIEYFIGSWPNLSTYLNDERFLDKPVSKEDMRKHGRRRSQKNRFPTKAEQLSESFDGLTNILKHHLNETSPPTMADVLLGVDHD